MKLSEIIGLKSAGAILATILLFSPVDLGSLGTSYLYKIACLGYILYYCYSSYIENQDPVVQAKQQKMIEDAHKDNIERLKKLFGRKT